MGKGEDISKVKIRNQVLNSIVLCLLVIVMIVTAEGQVKGATNTQNQIDQAEKEKDEIEGKLDEANDSLDDLRDTQDSLKGELNTLNDKLMDVCAALEQLERDIALKQEEINETQRSLEIAKEKEQEQYDSMVFRVREMYERNDHSYFHAIMQAGSFSDMLNVADYFEKIAAYDKKMLKKFKENRRLIEEQEAVLQTEKEELDHLKLNAEVEQNKVNGLISQTQNAVSKYGDDIAEAEERALAYEAELKRKEQDITVLRKKLAEEKRISEQAAQGEWRDISEIAFAEGDRYLLANLIYCEAGNQPYEGQVAVGSVVMNRVMSSAFPDTVVGVIYQRRQFSPVGSGRLQLALASNKATESCYRAADEAMSGVTTVGNCLFFRTPIEGLTGIQIGGHVFY